ncbi:hypothetical protein [Mangrovibrevibacter kandeliae]|uniref:hypothetical protein n=1 Tax=Mangrovibrevibacter kandeliae TaxID=2968473 RepID=UPI002118E065|nr:hypothetical protein [Aurantimonas sp. CSK15Z-1]MCQ8780979.1 hypothetical protein [Aurantimonas sp. CSK15Z-1]
MASELDASFELIGRVFEKLIKAGLRKIPLHAHDFEQEVDRILFRDVMSFLKDEGLIRVGAELVSGDYVFVQLTGAGIAAVESQKFENCKTVRSEVERGNLSSEAYGRIGAFVGGLIGGATTALGG